MFKKGEEIPGALQSLLFKYGSVSTGEPSFEFILSIGTQKFTRTVSESLALDWDGQIEDLCWKIDGYWPDANARVELVEHSGKPLFIAAVDISPFDLVEAILTNRGLKVAEDMFLKTACPDFYQDHIILRKPVQKTVTLQL